MNYNLKREWPLLVILAVPLVAAILIYPSLPEQVPIHWNLQGEVDDFGSRAFGAFFLPLLNIAMYPLFVFIPRLDPKRANYLNFEGSYLAIRYVLHLFFVLMFGITMAAALGHPVDVGKWIAASVALLFAVMGGLMGRISHNYFVGFRFPWTLASEEVWIRTHRFGSRLTVLGGVAAFIGVLFTKGVAAFAILMAGLFVPIVITTIYSFIVFKRL